MIHVHIGADVFGRVKTVAGTSVVTRFWGVNMFPLFPTESYYVAAGNTAHREGVPVGIRLASVDRASAAMTYVRGLAGAMFVVGFMGSAVGFYNEWLAVGAGPDEIGRFMIRVLAVVMIIGAIAGLLTYFVPVMSRRERRIREYCGQLLGPAIDPAKLTRADAGDIQKIWSDPPEDMPVEGDRFCPARRALILARCQIALGEDVELAERATDQLLNELD